MVCSCSAFGCTNRYKKGSNLTFHRFPLKKTSLLKSWLHVMPRKNWMPTKTSVLCSDHFEESCFITDGQRKRLVAEAIPTLFSLTKNNKWHKPPLKRFSIPENPVPLSKICSGSDTSEETIIPDIIYRVAESPKILNIKLEESDAEVTSSKKKLRSISNKSNTSEEISVCDHVFHVTESPKRLNIKLEQSDAEVAPHTYHSTESPKQVNIKLEEPDTEVIPLKKKSRTISNISNKSNIFEEISVSDNMYCVTESPKRLNIKLEESNDEVTPPKKKLRAISNNLEHETSSFKDILQLLKDKKLCQDEDIDALSHSLPNLSMELFENAAMNYKITNGRSYDEDVKVFAMSLYFLTPKAYEFVREKLFLPPSSTIMSWCQSIDGKPGFTEEVFSALHVVTNKGVNRMTCSLSLDEVSIRKQIIFSGGSQVGFVDFGTGCSNENFDIASEALVFMIVSVKDSWKVPIAYFLSSGVSGEKKSYLIDVALRKLHSAGVDIVSVACEGLITNFSMFRMLNVNFDRGDTCMFKHPCDKEKDITVIFDICHMVKLLRNVLADCKVLLDGKGNRIEWFYIEMLHKVQDEELLNAANMLKRDHMEWHHHKMKVKVAVQTFSESVANALLFLKKISYPGFQNCQTTANFFKDVEKLCDILNSRNPFGRGYKQPLRRTNKGQWEGHLLKMYKLILNLSTDDGKLIIASPHRICVSGICTTIKSVLYLGNTLLLRQDYILTFKFSQDHLELFFSLIRSKNGSNTYPNVVQFRSAYRQLVVNQLSISKNSTNCLPLNMIKMLPLKVFYSNGSSTDIVSVSQSRLKENCDETPLKDTENQVNEDIPNLVFSKNFTLYTDNTIVYICGFIVGKVLNTIVCVECKASLVDVDFEIENQSVYSLYNIKKRGMLISPSHSVCIIVKMTEKTLKSDYLTDALLVKSNSLINKLQCDVLLKLQGMKVFSTLDDHDSSCEFDVNIDNHSTVLIKRIIKEYAIVRLRHFSRKASEKIKNLNVRSKSNLVHFS